MWHFLCFADFSFGRENEGNSYPFIFSWGQGKVIDPSTHLGPLSRPVTKSGTQSRMLIAHVFVAYMITELNYALGGHFQGRSAAKNSNMILK